MTLLASLLTIVALNGPGATTLARPAVAPPDSIGVEMRGGQRFVKHRVAGGETLFGLARRYRVTVDQLNGANPQLANGLGVGQVLLVPRGAATAAATPATRPAAAGKPAPAPVASAKTHTVVKGETLFSIARRYQLTPAELARLNGMAADGSVRLGQQLTVAAATDGAAPPVAVTYQPKTTPTRPAEPESKVPDPAKPAQIATVTPAPREADKKEAEKETEKEDRAPTRASEVVTRVTESGLGAAIDKSVTDKYLALHKTAPVGTIMQVRNSMNGQSVYVRVIGKLPDTGENNNVLVRLSPRAVQKLGTPDSRFRVETSYVP